MTPARMEVVVVVVLGEEGVVVVLGVRWWESGCGVRFKMAALTVSSVDSVTPLLAMVCWMRGITRWSVSHSAAVGAPWVADTGS